MGIQEDATKLLLALANYEKEPNDSQKGFYVFEPEETSQLAGLPANRLNDAVHILEDEGYVTPMRFLGTAPYHFGRVELTPRGRLEAERIVTDSKSSSMQDVEVTTSTISRSAYPVGSPYGFTDQDWEAVSLGRDSPDRLLVVFGYQWQSGFYESAALVVKVEQMFHTALEEVRSKLPQGSVSLDFRPLTAGYGTHLFNQIARDIIASDIAVFETSDLNPNVMIEMGVALTWGVRVLPIRAAGASKPPSDISGQTWAEYTNSGGGWVDADHQRKLREMVLLAMRKKSAGSGTSRSSVAAAGQSVGRDPLDDVKTEFETFLSRFELEWELEQENKTALDLSGLYTLAEEAKKTLIGILSRIPSARAQGVREGLRKAIDRLQSLIVNRSFLAGDISLIIGVADVLQQLKGIPEEFDRAVES